MLNFNLKSTLTTTNCEESIFQKLYHRQCAAIGQSMIACVKCMCVHNSVFVVHYTVVVSTKR